MQCPNCDLSVLVEHGTITPHLNPDTLKPCTSKAVKPASTETDKPAATRAATKKTKQK